MLNQTVIVGRIVNEPTKEKIENGGNRSFITIAVPRSYKNTEGVYETDFVPVVLWNGIAETTAEYCHKGDLVGIKGHIQSSNYEEDGDKKSRIIIVAEKVTFLSSKSKDYDTDKSEDLEA